MYEIFDELAKKKGMTIKDLEQKAGLSNGSIGKYKTASPTIRTIEKIAYALDISAPYLVRKLLEKRNDQ